VGLAAIYYERIIGSDVGDSYFQCGGMDYGDFFGVAVCAGAQFSGLAVDVVGDAAVVGECDVCLHLAFF
jgi:hypothetical protein